MASFLADFNTRIASYVHELEAMQTRNKQEHAFAPSFWLEHDDFTLARDVFVAAGGSIGHEVTKFSLVYSSTTAPGATEAASICEALDKPCEQLLSAAKVALYSGAGPSLAREILTDALRLVKSVHDLGVAIAAGDVARVPQLTGRVWEYATTRVSKSNCVATKRSMLQCITVLNTTIDELQEVLDESNNSDDADELSRHFNAVDIDDAFAFDSSLAADEKTLFASGLKLLHMTNAVLKRGVRALQKYTTTGTVSSNEDALFLHWTAALDWCYSATTDHVVDVGAALYPPIEVDELARVVAALERASLAILAQLAAEPELPETTAAELETGRAAFTKQVKIVNEQIDASR